MYNQRSNLHLTPWSNLYSQSRNVYRLPSTFSFLPILQSADVSLCSVDCKWHFRDCSVKQNEFPGSLWSDDSGYSQERKDKVSLPQNHEKDTERLSVFEGQIAVFSIVTIICDLSIWVLEYSSRIVSLVIYCHHSGWIIKHYDGWH